VSLRIRLLLVMLAVYCAGGYALTRWLLEQVRPRYLESMEESLVDTAVLLASMLEAQGDGPLEPAEVASMREIFAAAQRQQFAAQIYTLKKTTLDLRVYVTDATGRVLFDSAGRAEGGDYARWNDVARTLQGGYGARATREIPGDESSLHLYVAAPIRRGGQIVGALSVGKPTRVVNQLVETAREKILWGAVIGGVALLVVLLLAAAWTVAPLERLTGYARAVRDGRAAPLPPLPGRTLRELGTAFEEMRDSLEGRQHVERYTQTLAHEVKAPLAAIRGAAELMTEEMPAEQRAKFLANIRTEAARIQQIVERLLELSSLEARKALRRSESVSAAKLMTEAGDAVRGAYASKGVDLSIDILNTDAVVRGEPVLLREALVNLLQNALDFSRGGSTVTLRMSVARDAGSAAKAVFVVTDQGAGVPEYALPRVFERFYSLPRPSTGRKSTGLGLSLVREIAHLHGGDASLENSDARGAIAKLWLPLEHLK
jgi:two-component system, OmpR family, sensor histidine kinase CreC